MNLNYHIPVPFLQPTEDELEYANDKIIPVAEHSARELFSKLGPKFDKTYIDQDLVGNWGTGKRVKEHFNELGLAFRRFSLFVGAPGATSSKPHIDGNGPGNAMICRLNVPLRGVKGSRLSWWNADKNDSRILERYFQEWNSEKQEWQFGFSYLADPNIQWKEPDWYIDEPGPCWNRVELAHLLGLDNTTEIRINITAELLEPVQWSRLVEKLQSKGYC
jgi:hypothetical protein